MDRQGQGERAQLLIPGLAFNSAKCYMKPIYIRDRDTARDTDIDIYKG